MKQLKNIFLFLVLLFFSIIVSAQKTNTIIDSLVAKTIKEYNIPAISASLVTSDNVFYGIGGITKINDSKKVTLQSKFHLGSNTKAITASVAMKMIENKELNLDTKFVDVFPELRDNIKKVYQEITLADLLSHKAQIQPYTSGLEYIKLPKFKGKVSDKRYEFAKFVLNEEPVTKGTYSNAGYAIVSLLLEKKSGVPFEELVKKYMTDLKLDFFFGFPNKETENNPAGHWKENDKWITHTPENSYKLKDFMLSAGDISMNIIDYSKFIQLNLNGLEKDNYLLKESYKKLHFNNEGYSFGWINAKINNLLISTHNGSAGTYYCHAILIPKFKIAVIVMTNSAGKNQLKGIVELRENILKNSKKIADEI